LNSYCVFVICVQTIERGFAFLKDPLFLASSVFVKKPSCIMAMAFVMVLCLSVYQLAEVRVGQRLATTEQTAPDQVRKPTARPTMRWLFLCFKGIDLHHTLLPDGTRWSEVLRLHDLHRLMLRLLGPAYEHRYLVLYPLAKCVMRATTSEVLRRLGTADRLAASNGCR